MLQVLAVNRWLIRAGYRGDLVGLTCPPRELFWRHRATLSRARLSPHAYKAEEIQNSPSVVPLSMGISTLLNGSMGFSMLIALLFCMPSNIHDTLSSETYCPFMSIHKFAVGSTSGATAMVSPSNDSFRLTLPYRHSIFRNTADVQLFPRKLRPDVICSFHWNVSSLCLTTNRV